MLGRLFQAWICGWEDMSCCTVAFSTLDVKGDWERYQTRLETAKQGVKRTEKILRLLQGLLQPPSCLLKSLGLQKRQNLYSCPVTSDEVTGRSQEKPGGFLLEGRKAGGGGGGLVSDFGGYVSA
jgi:hypothetical protein